MFEKEKWIERNLREHGNCVLARWRIDRFGGKKAMIDELASLGMKCEFTDLKIHGHKERWHVKCYIIYDVDRKTIVVD